MKTDKAAQVSDPKLTDVIKRLTDAYRPERMYLFGSRARADAREDSDYDILLVVGDESPARRRTGGLAYEVLFGSGAAVDVIVVTASWFERRAHLASGLPGTVLREGRLLYAS